MFIYWVVIFGLVITVLAQVEEMSTLRGKYELELKKNHTYELYQCPMCKEEKKV